MLIDSHAHLTSLPEEGLEALLERARAAGVTAIVNIATRPSELDRGLLLSKKYPWIYHALATTPHDVEKEGELYFGEVEKRIPSLVALGETGLDYHYEHSPRALQQHFLKRYLALASLHSLPLIFHCRDAFPDLLRLADEASITRACLHCFTGTLSEAQEVLERGWYISFSGIITFKKSDTLRATAATIPLNRLLIETDTPYLAPHTHRGHPNEPSYLPETLSTLASLHSLPPSTLATHTATNAQTLFNLPKDSQ